MDHVAIMRKSWGLTRKILSGGKRIESRWYKNKYAPWGKIKKGEIVYFKDSGELVTIKAEVEKILQFDNLNPQIVRQILDKCGRDDGIEESNIQKYFDMFKDKKYCMLIFLKNPQKVESFEIDKTGFGAMASWICIENIDRIRM